MIDEDLTEDEKLELAIDAEYLKFATCKNRHLALRYYNRMTALCKQRSQNRVREMEERAGLE